MRLLHATAQPLRFETFYGDAPPYAILSHTWGREDEEATFQDLKDGTGMDKPGYRKVTACCYQAFRDGIDYVWIDSCCIDKTNSVELQEAINSMFNWYKKSTICYAYLSDYDKPAGTYGFDEQLFRDSKWFTRGWTLQELIAPTKVVFYDRRWVDIGSRIDLGNLISSITRISTKILGGEDLELSSVAQRMSWASIRQTTRAEDIAYCLLGIFGVHMPLIYGEGGVEAFIRLQRAIMEQSDDQSLFAWKQEQGPAAHGLLATSPAYFANSSHIVRMQKSMSHRPAYRMTNRGLEIQLYITCGLLGGDHIALLDCADSETLDTVGVYVTPMRDGRFLRINLDKLTILTQSPLNKRYKKSTLETLHIPQLYLSEKPTPKLIKFVVRDSVFNYKRHPEPNRLIKSLNYALPSSLSLIQTGTAPVTFTPMVTTEAGRKGRGENFNTVEFTLQVGGRGGVLFVPCGTGTFSPHVTRSRPSSSILRHVAVIIGVNLDESVYAEILTFRHCDGMPYNAESSRFLPWAQSIPQSIRLDQVGSIDWFGNYVMQASVDSSGRKSEVEVRDLLFCANVVQLTIPRSSNEVDYYDVFVSYSPKS